jgi:hypothetical protein
MAKRAAPDGAADRDGGTGSAPGIAAFMAVRAILDLLVQQGSLTHQAVGLALLKRASALDTNDPVKDIAQRLLLELSRSHSEGHRRQGPSRPRAGSARR